MRDRFHSDERIAKLAVPLLIIHGEKDTVIPIGIGRRLFDLAPGRKRFVALPQGTHINLDELGAVAIAQRFMAGDGKD